jgi:hypothetical protein
VLKIKEKGKHPMRKKKKREISLTASQKFTLFFVFSSIVRVRFHPMRERGAEGMKRKE